jgi:hypothetical protein
MRSTSTRSSFLFAERATIHDIVHAQRQGTLKAVEQLSPESILTGKPDELLADFVERFHLSVPILDRKATVQLPTEDVDVNVSGDFRRPFLDPNRPHYVKGTAIRIAVPFEGEAILFKYGVSPLNSPIPGEIRDDTVVLSHIAEHPDSAVVRREFENNLDRIENMLDMVRGPAEEWNRGLPALLRECLQQRRSKLERDQGLSLGYPAGTLKQPSAQTTATAKPKAQTQMYDLFLSHASEDKEAIARPLYSALVAQGLSVWFDEAVLKLGDSLRRKIDEGLSKCRYGIVILSPRFLSKQWPQRELDGLVARETASGEKAILPIWHEIDRDGVLKYSPPLADRIAGRSEEGIDALVQKIREAIHK